MPFHSNQYVHFTDGKAEFREVKYNNLSKIMQEVGILRMLNHLSSAILEKTEHSPELYQLSGESCSSASAGATLALELGPLP